MFLNLILTPTIGQNGKKKSSEGYKTGKRDPNCGHIKSKLQSPNLAKLKTKNIELHLQDKNLQSTLAGSKNVFEPNPNVKNRPTRPKNSPKGPKKVQKLANIWLIEKKKIGLYLQKSLLSNTVFPKNIFEPDPNPKVSSEDQIKNKIWGSNFTQSIIQFKSFSSPLLGFVDAPVMCISTLMNIPQAQPKYKLTFEPRPKSILYIRPQPKSSDLVHTTKNRTKFSTMPKLEPTNPCKNESKVF